MNISDRVKVLGLPADKYVVVGGAMEAFGIRPANDLDIVVTEDLFNELQQKGWKLCECDKCRAEWKLGSTDRILKGDGVDILSEFSCGELYHKDTDELIKNAAVIDGVAFVQLEELLKWKKAAAREKDLKDIVLIEEFLAKQKKS
ncbi:MAG: hypothetical protein ABR884_03920 [Minisyncoccia bacterium]|jgi:hypothetical protein